MSIVGKKQFTKEQRMKFITNKHNLPFELVVELIHNDSNHDDTPDMSASGMAMTVRQQIFSYRYPELSFAYDLTDVGALASHIGNARHLWAEKAWNDPLTRKMALKLCGLNDAAIDAIRVNPLKVEPNTIPVFTEKGFPIKTVNGVTIGGTADLIFNGMIEDYKTVSPWVLKYPTTLQAYVMQMSVYRWLDPKLITKSQGKLNFRFLKWDEKSTNIEGYPKMPTMSIVYDLYPLEVVEDFVDKKTKQILENIDKPDDALPPCPEHRLDVSKVWKIFTKYENFVEGKASRRTITTSLDDALVAMQSIKTGVLLEITGKPSLCRFCAFTTKCNQYSLINNEQVKILKEW